MWQEKEQRVNLVGKRVTRCLMIQSEGDWSESENEIILRDQSDKASDKD